MTVSPLAPDVVPVIVGVVSAVMPSVGDTPVSLALVSPSEPGTGAVVSMSSESPPDGMETLPARSVSWALRVCGPTPSALPGVTDQVPPLTVALPIAVPPS